MFRRVSLLVLAAIAAALIAGCGGGQDQQSEGGGAGGGGQAEGGGETTAAMEGELSQVSRFQEPVYGSSFVSPLAEIFGDVYIGERSFVAGNTVLRAGPERAFTIGNETNAQDNVIARALGADSSVGNRSTLAHHANVRDSEIADFAFVGFPAEIVDSTVSNGALVSAGACVEGVTLPENALVPPGAEITTREDADALERIGGTEEEFKEAVLGVNGELAEGYVQLYESEGYDSVTGVSPNPEASFNPESIEPRIGEGTEIGELARVVGDVSIGRDSEISDRAAIRADEGHPIVIGANADIEERVTFHALEGTSIEAGDDLTAGDDAVLHGPLEAGDGLTVGDDSVVFRVIVEDDVTVGDDVTIQGPAVEEGEEVTFTIPAGTVIPDGALITDEASLQEVLNDQ